MTDQPTEYVVDAVERFTRWRDRVALVHAGTAMTYHQMLAQAYRFARTFEAAGLRRGEGLVFVGGNVPQAQTVALAAYLLGLRLTPVHLSRATAQLAHVLADADPAAVVFEPDRARACDVDVVRLAGGTAARRLFSVGPGAFSTGPGAFSAGPGADGPVADLLAEAAAQSADPVPVRARDADIARVLYTGGTTGRPKGVVYTFATLAGVPARPAPPGPDDLRFLVTTPLAHAAGAYAFATLRNGGTVELFDGFDPGEMLAAIGRAAADGVPVASYLYPPQLYRLLAEPAVRTTDLTSVRFLAYGSAPVVPARLVEAVAVFGPVLQQSYAQTEAVAVTALGPDDHARAAADRPELFGSVGRPVPGVRLRISDPHSGTELPGGATGEVCVAGPTVMNGYWQRPDLTAQVVRDGWLHTGDLGRVDEEGYLYLVGRLKEMVIVSGHNCYTKPIEDALATHPAVAEAAVVGTPDERTGEAIVAFVVLRVPVDPAALRATVRAALGEAHVPSVVTVLERMPVTPLGKPDKHALRASVERGAEVRVEPVPPAHR